MSSVLFFSWWYCRFSFLGVTLTAKSRKSISFIEGYTDLANLLQGFTLQDCSNACMLAFSVAVFQLLDHVQSVVVIIVVILCGCIFFFPGLIQS
jgi:hypothetical protein